MNKIIRHSFLSEKDTKIKLIDGAKAYAELSKEVTKAGILDRAYGYYILQISFVCICFFLSLLGIILANNLIAVAALSTIFGFFTVQIAGLIHDAGHRSILKSTKNNDIVGYIFGALIAVNFTTWKIRHNKHHANPNQEDEDPDVNIPVISFSEERYKSKKGFEKWLCKYQDKIYYPIISLTSFAERTGAVKYFKKNITPIYLLEYAILFSSALVWFVSPFVFFSLPKAVVVFLFLHLTSGFYIGNIFAPNHKGMPEVKKGIKISFFEHQIITTRNVKGSFLTDYLYMGLNYQMEHHLFPNCPRNKLGLITPYLKKTCKKLGLDYTETGVIESNKIIVSELRKLITTAA